MKAILRLQKELQSSNLQSNVILRKSYSNFTERLEDKHDNLKKIRIVLEIKNLRHDMLSHLRIHLQSSFFSTTRRPPSDLKVPKMKSMGPIWVYGFEKNA